MQIKMKYKDVPALRDQLLKEQNNICALCNELIQPGEEVLDHCHQLGSIRAVLHRGCNALEGIIVSKMTINKITPTRLENICNNLIAYQKQVRTEVHPTFGIKKKRKKKKVVKKSNT